MVTNLLQNIKKVAVCMSVAAATAFGAQAADTVDLGELQNGVAKEYPGGFSTVTARFTVPEDGPMRVVCTGTELNAYGSSDYDEESALAFEHSYVDGKSMRTYQCKAGDVVYFYNGFVMDAGTITVTCGDVKLSVLSFIPSDNPDDPTYYGGSYSISRDYRVTFNFNLPVEIAGGRMSVGTTTQELSVSQASTIAEVEVSAGLMQWYKSGLLKKGDTVRVELYGVHEKGKEANKVNGDGVAYIDYVMAGQPLELVSTVNTPLSGVDNILSYYEPGNPAALLTLTFSGDLDAAKTPWGEVTYGDLEAGMYNERLEGSVSGATVTYDLAGKLRRPQDMLPLLTEPLDYLTIFTAGIYGTDGQPVYTGNVSNPSNFFFTYKIQVLQYNVVGDFTPSASKGLEEGKELEIFVMEGNKIQYSGVKFAYTAGGEAAEVIVPKDKLDEAMEGDTDLVITLAVPALPGIDADSEVTVTLADMTCADGLDHTDSVKEVYKSFTVGIEGVEADAEARADVYNAQGILVLKGADKAQMRALPAGLYIAGGRKFINK